MENLTWIVLLSCIGLAWPNPPLGELLFSSLAKRIAALARNQAIAVLAIGSSVILVRILLLAWIPVPQPKIHDEYGYLLAADTFYHGRLANPSHPLWAFFDTFRVIQHPTYSSIYPPAQGAILAVGKLLGHPWVGVLLSTAAMCAAMTWMLQAWMPPRWALLGGIITLLKFGILGYWINSYWGGSVSATGAALVMGAFPRIKKKRRVGDALVFGLGIAILATSRPFEGFIFCIPVGAAFLWWCYRQTSTPAGSSAARGVFAPVALSIACVVGFTAYYNWRVTKNPFLFPESVDQREYLTTPVFIWQREKPPLTYSNPQFDVFYNTWLPSTYQTNRSGVVKLSMDKASQFWHFFLGFPLALAFLTAPQLLRNRKLRLIFTQFGLSAAGLLLVVWFHPHYAAPVVTSVIVLVIQGLRYLRTWKIRGRPIGVSLVRWIVFLTALTLPVNLLAYKFPAFANYWTVPELGMPPRYVLLLLIAILFLILLRAARRTEATAQVRAAISLLEFGFLLVAMWQACIGTRSYKPDEVASPVSARSSIEQQFFKLPGEHLVIVRYSSKHSVHEEYVYNEG
jgi:hypothetical protein